MENGRGTPPRRHLMSAILSKRQAAPARAMRISPDLAKDVTVVEFGLPGPADFGKLLDRIVDDVRENPHVKIDLDADARERLLHAARGLTLRRCETINYRK